MTIQIHTKASSMLRRHVEQSFLAHPIVKAQVKLLLSSKRMASEMKRTESQEEKGWLKRKSRGSP